MNESEMRDECVRIARERERYFLREAAEEVRQHGDGPLAGRFRGQALAAGMIAHDLANAGTGSDRPRDPRFGLALDLARLDAHNVIVHQCLTMKRRGELTYEEALLLAVKYLAEQNDALLEEATRRSFQPPLVVPVPGVRVETIRPPEPQEPVP